MIRLLWKEKKEIPPKRKDFLKKAICDCQQAINDAYLGLQNTNEPDLIDRYIYEMNAANVRYRFLLKEMRELSASSAPSISPTNLETDTSLLNRSTLHASLQHKTSAAPPRCPLSALPYCTASLPH